MKSNRELQSVQPPTYVGRSRRRRYWTFPVVRSRPAFCTSTWWSLQPPKVETDFRHWLCSFLTFQINATYVIWIWSICIFFIWSGGKHDNSHRGCVMLNRFLYRILVTIFVYLAFVCRRTSVLSSLGCTERYERLHVVVGELLQYGPGDESSLRVSWNRDTQIDFLLHFILQSPVAVNYKTAKKYWRDVQHNKIHLY